MLPDKSSLCTPNFLSRLISLGIYNFTSKVNGIKYLLKKSNTLEDVAHIRTMVNKDYSHDPSASSNNSVDNSEISEIKNSQIQIEKLNFEQFLKALAITSMFFNYKDIVTDLDRLLYLCYIFITNSDLV